MAIGYLPTALHEGTGVSIDEFRRVVKREFGERLEHATPANVREFLDRLQEETYDKQFGARLELNEPATSYEEILKDFFARVLDMPKDEALVLLWTMAFDLSFSALEQHLADRFEKLFEPSE